MNHRPFLVMPSRLKVNFRHLPRFTGSFAACCLVAAGLLACRDSPSPETENLRGIEAGAFRSDRVRPASGPGDSQPHPLDADLTPEELSQLSDRDLLEFFKRLDARNPRLSCALLLQLPHAQQQRLLARSVARLGEIDPLAAFDIIDSLEAGRLRQDCVRSLGEMLTFDDWDLIGPRLPAMSPQDRLTLVHSTGEEVGELGVRHIVRSLEEHGIDGEPLALAKSRLAAILGRDQRSTLDPDLAAQMSGREKAAYIHGALATDPNLALTEALRLAETDDEIFPKVANRIALVLLDMDDPAGTLSMVSNLEMGAREREILTSGLLKAWILELPQSASGYILEMPHGVDRQNGIREILNYLESVGDTRAATQWRALLEEETAE